MSRLPMTTSSSARGARLTLWVLMIGMLVLIAWAALAQIDQVTRARGQVIAASHVQVIQSADGGILRRLNVKEGEAVKAGQLLGMFEKARVQAAVDDSRAKVAALRISLARLRAEVYGTPLQFDDTDTRDFPEYIENQRSLYQKRRTAFTEDIAALQRVRTVAVRELAMNRQLEATNDVSHADILRMERAIAETEVQITSRRNKFFQDAQADMTKAQEELNTQMESLNDRSQLLEQTDLIAPVDGVVKNIKVTTLGGVVRAGDTVLEILPSEGGLIVEAKVYPADIAFVRVGQDATVKLDAWDSSVFGGFNGQVIYVSPDTLTEETVKGPMPYYRVRVRIGHKEFAGERSQPMEIRPGMTAQVDILAMRRTVLSYLVNPVSKMFSQAMREL